MVYDEFSSIFQKYNKEVLLKKKLQLHFKGLT